MASKLSFTSYESTIYLQLQKYFQRLSDQRLYNKSNVVDRITFLALYLPIVQEEVYKYIELWNVHNIWKQPKRPNAITGKPKFNYTYSKNGKIRYRRPVDPEILDGINQEYAEWGLLSTLLFLSTLSFYFFPPLFPLSIQCIVRLTLNIDIDEFLPSETLAWISQQLERVNVDLPNLRGADLLADGSRLYFQVYLQLRELVQAHIISSQEPALSETLRPLGGYEAVEARRGYLSGVLQENRAYRDSYEAEPIRELILSPDFQDFEGDKDWVNAISNGIVQQDKAL
jgi:hypothetical protein